MAVQNSTPDATRRMFLKGIPTTAAVAASGLLLPLHLFAKRPSPDDFNGYSQTVPLLPWAEHVGLWWLLLIVAAGFCVPAIIYRHKRN